MTRRVGIDPQISELKGWCEALTQGWRARGEAFKVPGLFGDPAWEMLVAIYNAELEGAPASASQLARSAAWSHSTGMRWLNALISEGLVRKVDSGETSNLPYVELTEPGRRKIESVLLEMGKTHGV